MPCSQYEPVWHSLAQRGRWYILKQCTNLKSIECIHIPPYCEMKLLSKFKNPALAFAFRSHTGLASRALIREVTKWPPVTLEDLQRSTAHMGESVHRTTKSCALNKSALHRRVSERELLKEGHKKSCMQFVTSHVGNTTDVEEVIR